MSSVQYSIVPTALGVFGAAWGEAGIVGTWMHERTPERTRAQILRAFPGARESDPPAVIAAALADVVAMLEGDPRTPAVGLDMRGVPDFERRVFELARTIPYGETLTYGAVASALGEEPMRARDVGQAMAHNRFAPIVPCHRVVAANGQLGGYSAPGGASTKRRLLELEGAAIVAPPAHAVLFD